MKAIYKHFYLTLCTALAFAMGACTEEVEYTPAEPQQGASVYFPNTLPSQMNLDSQSTSFDVQVGRTSTDAATIELSVSDESGLFTIPTSVSFAAGEQVANLTISYNPEDLEYDDFKTITLAVADGANTTPYGTSSYTFKAGIPAPWTSLGYGTFVDTWMFANSYKVEIQQNDLNPSIFRLVNPYAEGLEAEEYYPDYVEEGPSEYVEFRILKPGDQVGSSEPVTVTMNDLVAYSDFATGYYIPDYKAEVYCIHPYRVGMEEGLWSYNTVKSYQENGLPAIVQLAPLYYMFGVGGWDYTQYDEVITIAFPGIVLLESWAEVTYTGLFNAVDNSISAVAEIELGEDVESAKVALVPAGDADAAVQAIIDGSIEAVEIEASGEVKLPLPADATEGKYAIVVVTYVGGEPQKSASTTFKYTPANAETWTEIAMGDYAFAEDIFFSGVQEGLTLSVSNENANRYKISNWAMGVDFKFTYEAETGNVVVDDQETGYVHPEYGMIYVADYTNFGTDATSLYQEGVFYFAVVYYDADGVWGAGYDTFTLTDTASQSTTARSMANQGMSILKGQKHESVWKHMNPVYVPLMTE